MKRNHGDDLKMAEVTERPSKRLKTTVKETWTFTRLQLKNLINRVRVAQLGQLGYQQKKIAREVNVSLKVVKKYRNVDFDVENLVDAPRLGRPVQFDEKMKEKINKIIQKNGMSPRKLARREKMPSRTTIRRTIKAAKLKSYKKRKAGGLQVYHKAARVAWCMNNADWSLEYFEKLLITDSKVFTVDGGYNPQNQRFYRQTGDDVPVHELNKSKKGVHVYAGMSARGLTKLIFIEGAITAKRYVDEVLNKMLKDVKSRRLRQGSPLQIQLFKDSNDFILEQDHASSHDAKLTQQWCDEHDALPDYLSKDDTPSKMDDLWPIERLWGIITGKVYAVTQPKDVKELKRRIRKAWREINPQTLKKLVHQMPLRMAEIVKNDGNKLQNFKKHCDCHDHENF